MKHSKLLMFPENQPR